MPSQLPIAMLPIRAGDQFVSVLRFSQHHNKIARSGLQDVARHSGQNAYSFQNWSRIVGS
jgi:hypothetical protein